jgi:uncharacterized membrane protein YkoI
MLNQYKLSTIALALALACVGTAAGAAGTTGATSSTDNKSAEQAPGAKPALGTHPTTSTEITMAVARAIALKAHPGKISDAELEKEDGGTGMRYSFDIKDGKGTQEVGVDAQTGVILENKPEGPNPD